MSTEASSVANPSRALHDLFSLDSIDPITTSRPLFSWRTNKISPAIRGDHGIDIGASAQPAREEIPAAPQPTGFQGLAGPRGTADNLKKLTGVSGAIEKKLNDLGIFHYWQLAELDHDTAHKIGEEVGLSSRADAWVAKAKALTAEAE